MKANPEKSNSELGMFLRTRRERLSPESVGLPAGRRRRTPGLRRDEVAMLAGISGTWYTFLEQGRSVRASVGTLRRIADVLRLSGEERRHLATLAGVSLAEAADSLRLPKGIQEVLDALEPCPSYVLDHRFDVVACNESARLLWGYDVHAGGRARNMLWQLFTDRNRRAVHGDWAMAAGAIVARFRPIYARHANDETLRELVTGLRERSPEFRALWARHEVLSSEDLDFVFRFKGVRGRFTFFSVFAPGDHTMCVLIPVGRRAKGAPGPVVSPPTAPQPAGRDRGDRRG